ncbi:MAG: hypothetical protein PHU04_03420 [Candidatus Peribacteraceae bacterium]|nr:hypothetical protein [Candidatus Peribacteraceae bacterium]
MRKSLAILIALIIIVVAYGVWRANQSPEVDLDPIAAACTDEGGTWLAAHAECESIRIDVCAELEGTFDECASACRHSDDPTAPCTMQCVQVCSFRG